VKTATANLCPECGTPARERDRLCRLCGHLFHREERAARAAPAAEPPPEAVRSPALAPASPGILGLPEPWFFLIVGFAIAPVFAMTPLLGLIGWYFAALVHEIGHCVAGWLVGQPAYPVLGLNGHAMACGEPFSWLVVLAVFAAGIGATWHFLGGRLRWGVLAAIVVGYPLLVFTTLADILTVTGGHLGELVFAGVFLFRTITGGFTASHAERGLYSVMGWYLIGANLWLTGGLMFSDAARFEYSTNGSYGLTNDYIVLADQVVGGSLESVAAIMSLAALAVVPLALGICLLLVRRTARA